MNSHSISCDNVKEFVKMYNSGEKLIPISKHFGCSYQSVRYHLKKMGVRIKSISEQNRKFFVKSNYFDVIDSHEKAQILGFIAADGCISNNSLIISISDKDIDYLNEIKNRLGYTGNIKINNNKGSFSNKDSKCARLVIKDSNIVKSLAKIGIFPRKGLTLEFPLEKYLPEMYINSYILGYLEGDGCIVVNKNKRLSTTVSFCGTKKFLTSISEYIKHKFKINSTLLQQSNCKLRDVNNYSLSFGGNQQNLIILKWLYSNSSFKMRRKYEKYMTIINMYSSGRFKMRKLIKNINKGLYENFV